VRIHAERAGWSQQQIGRVLTEQGRPLPRVDFVPGISCCPGCQAPLGVYKTHTRTVLTLAQGHFQAKQTQLRCDCNATEPSKSCPTIRSEELSGLVPPGQSFGYDLIVSVGLARYLGGKQRKEIRVALEERDIYLSAGSISNLCDRFLKCVELLHLKHTAELRAVLAEGYSLHLDATSDSGKGGLFLCMDGMRGWVLVAERIATENGEALAAMVKRTVELFGDPVATMRDLGKAMAGAVSALRERGIPDLVCHYHFLRAVGSRLLRQPYDRLRKMLKDMALRSQLVALRRQLRPYLGGADPEGYFGPGQVREGLLALVHWIIEGQGGKDPNFPFSMPHVELALRCRAACEVASRWLPRPWNQPERKAMQTLDSLQRKLDRDQRMAPSIAELRERWRVFCDLRAVLRLGDDELPAGQRSHQLPIAPAELLRLDQIKLAVHQYEDDLRQRAGADANKKRPRKPESIVLRYLKDYRDNLFGHPAIRDDHGQVIAVTPRTNNPAENFFGCGKQNIRRRVGRAHLGRDLQQQPAQVALAANLRHSDYVRIVCGSLDNLPHTFARLDHSQLRDIHLERDHRDSRLDRLVCMLTEQLPVPEDVRLAAPSQDFALRPTGS